MESAENYLEAILMLGKDHDNVRSIDVAQELGFSKPSVSVAMKHFREEGLISVDASGFITLSDSGRLIAERTYERHRILTDCLVRLGVNPKTAAEDACKTEHVISAESFDAIKKYFSGL